MSVMVNIERHTTFCVVSPANDIIAECILTPRDGVIFLTGVYVHHEHRRQGIASQLIQAALEYAGDKDIWLYVWSYAGRPLSDHRLIQFYESFGFSRIPDMPLLMRRPGVD